MTRLEWLGTPEITDTGATLAIGQRYRVAAFKPVWAEITVVRYVDGSIRLQAGYADGPVEIPGHWMPVLNEFLLRVEVSA